MDCFVGGEPGVELIWSNEKYVGKLVRSRFRFNAAFCSGEKDGCCWSSDSIVLEGRIVSLRERTEEATEEEIEPEGMSLKSSSAE